VRSLFHSAFTFTHSIYSVHELKIFMFNDRDLTRRYYSSYSLLFACFGHFDFSPICTGRVYGARRSTSLLSANESRLQRIREVYARSKKKICEGGRRDAMVVGNVGLQ